MIDNDLAAELDALAQAIALMRPPQNHKPDAFHEDRSELASRARSGGHQRWDSSVRLKARCYIRSIDRRHMVEIEPGSFVNLRSARRLGLVAKAKRRAPPRRALNAHPAA